MAALTALSVKHAKPDPTKRLELPDSVLPGLYLVIQPSGRKSWAVRYRIDGKPSKYTIGAYPLYDLAAAREQARAKLQSASEGRDPAAEKRAVKVESAAAVKLRFGAVAAEFIERYAKPRNRTWKQTQALLTTGESVIAWQAKDIRAIGRRDVLDAMDSMIARGAETNANRLFAALRRFFGWAVERGIIDASPMAGLKPPSPEVSRDRVLSDVELAAAWKAAEQVGYPFGSALQLLILTGQRRSEVLEAEWREFDLDAATWTIPRERAKNDTAHVVALSPRAVEILSALPRIGSRSRLLFTTNGETPFSGISKATDRLQRIAGTHLPDDAERPPWRLHDIRRTFASGCARLGIAVHVVEKALNHTSGTFGGIVGVYQRHTFNAERRRAMDLWAVHVDGLVNNSGKVIKQGRRAS